MRFRTFGSGVLRKSVALFACLVLIAAAAATVFAQDDTAVLSGVILDPEGAPANGFKVVVRDLASNKTFESGPTDAEGNYSVNVPLGGRYKIDYVVANDGVTKLPVQDVAPVSVLTAGTTRVNVRFTSSTAPVQPTAESESEEKDKSAAAAPWYRRPGPIVGIVLGAGAVAAIVLNGGSDDNAASPSYP